MPDSDADQLARLSHVPGFLFVCLFALIDIAVLVIGVFMLAGQWITDLSPAA
jgi:hypothetical protein